MTRYCIAYTEVSIIVFFHTPESVHVGPAPPLSSTVHTSGPLFIFCAIDNTYSLGLSMEFLRQIISYKEKGYVIYKKVHSLFCYQNKSCGELADRRFVTVSSPANDSFSNLPSELLEGIFRYLTPADISRVSRACSRFYFICQTRRQHLPRPCLSDLTVTYGKWRDVLKYRGNAYHDMNTVEYKVISTSTSKKKRHRKMEKRALNEIIESCSFQV
ncbi:f-box-like domain-containing protein [Ditylenchus destructor]|nr:f-box-like domain-containing protein [Ditylenchus destructor]